MIIRRDWNTAEATQGIIWELKREVDLNADIREKLFPRGTLLCPTFPDKRKKTDYKALRLRSCHVRILALKRSLIFHLFVHPLASLTALSRAHLCHGPLSAGQTRGAHFPARWRPDCNVGEVGRIIMLFPVAELEMNTDISPWTQLPFLISNLHCEGKDTLGGRGDEGRRAKLNSIPEF